MRDAARTLVAAAIAGGAMVAVAAFSAYRLADAPVRGRLAGPDPIGSLASLVALAVALVAFFRLGHAIAADTTTARSAIVAGAIAGALAGLVAGVGQSFALSEYLTAVLAGYAVPPEFLAIALGAYVLLAAGAAAAVGAAITYAGWHRARPVSRPDTPR